MENRDLTQLKGKTILKTEWLPYTDLNSDNEPVDDGNYLRITFTDDFHLDLHAGYTEWTGNSLNEYPTYLSAVVRPPEGYNGPGMYEAKPIHSIYNEEGEWLGYQFHFDGEVKVIPTGLFRFRCDSLEHAAKSLLNLDEVEYVKWDSKPYNYES